MAARRPPRLAAPSKNGSPKSRLPRILLVDDHPLWRRTLKVVIEHERAGRVVGEASDGEEALSEAARERPDVVVMDIGMPRLDGIETTRRLLAAFPEARILALSSSDERTSVIAAVRAGAAGYLLKTAGPAEVTDAIRRIASGEVVFPAELAEVVLGELRRESEAGRPVRVAVVSESVLGHEGLAHVAAEAGFDVVGGCRPGPELRRLLEQAQPDVVVADVGGESVVAVLEDVRAVAPEAGLLIVTDSVNAPAASDLLGTDRGAGWLLKSRVADVERLADAIRRVAAGESVVDPEVANRLVSSPAQASPLAELTERERAVLSLMAEGRSNQAIRQRLFMSARTVETHVASIFTKLGLEPAPDDQRRVLAVLAYLESS